MTGFDFDTSEVRKLSTDLGRVPGRLVPALTKVTEDRAKRVQTAMRREAGGLRHAPHFPRSITYDMRVGIGRIGAEIGPDKDRRQGALGNILYFGTVNNGPVIDLNGPLDREQPRFAKAVQDAAGDLL